MQSRRSLRRKEHIHWRVQNIIRYEGRAILLLRNPYEAIISQWNHRKADNEVDSLRNLEESFKSEEFQKFASIEIK